MVKGHLTDSATWSQSVKLAVVVQCSTILNRNNKTNKNRNQKCIYWIGHLKEKKQEWETEKQKQTNKQKYETRYIGLTVKKESKK